jgi:pimeloyl-ACP methyl ester carboxylesterase
MSEKPTILFFAGAFADPSCFDTISVYFNRVGYPTAYAHVLSLNPSDPTISTSADADHTRDNYLSPLLEEGKDIIIFTHSYGGVVAGQAAAGHSKTARAAEGKKGGVVGLLYLAGNIVGEKESLLEAVGGEYPPFIKQNHVSHHLRSLTSLSHNINSHHEVSRSFHPSWKLFTAMPIQQ